MARPCVPDRTVIPTGMRKHTMASTADSASAMIEHQ